MKNTMPAILSLAIILLAEIALGDDNVPYLQPESASSRNQFIRALTCYISGGISGQFVESCFTAHTGSIRSGHIPESAKENLGEAKITGSDLFDLSRLREWLNTWSYPLRGLRHHDQIITNDLTGFDRATSYKKWVREIIPLSNAKQKTRVIYRSPESYSHRISVAETYDSLTGDLRARLIETEIAIERLDESGNADFYSYNSQGQLSSTSMFPAGERAVPGVCLGCHYNATTGKFVRQAN